MADDNKHMKQFLKTKDKILGLSNQQKSKDEVIQVFGVL